MTDNAPNSREKELLAMHENASKLIRRLEYGLAQFSSSRDRQLNQAKSILKEIEHKLGYEPQTAIDKEMEELTRKCEIGYKPQKSESSESTNNDLSDHLWIDPTFTGPRGGRYRINSNGRKSYDVP